ncbi:MAG TPA: DddA-like double-stranded DNA deaminase toxin, partial [Luteitalea sp.]|nr:DddA-like double-stranded DNA deaminase toxin [Luteitalea sp.]
MSDLADLASAVTDALAAIKAARQIALHAASGFGEAATELKVLTAGSAIADIPMLYDQARTDVEQQVQSVEVTAKALRNYLASLGRVEGPASPPNTAPQAEGEGRRGRPGMHTTMPTGGPPQDERADELRSELPPPVQKGGAHQKTHGRWLTPDADAEAQTLTSGKDEMSQAAEQFLRNNGLAGRGMPSAVYDVEMKLAVHMATNGITHAAVTINNTPCIGP